MLDRDQVMGAVFVQPGGVLALGVQRILCGARGYADQRPGALAEGVSRAR
jgi:hypothetical protein